MEHALCLDQSEFGQHVSNRVLIVTNFILTADHAFSLAQFVVKVSNSYTSLTVHALGLDQFYSVHLYFNPAPVQPWTVCTNALYICTLCRGSLAPDSIPHNRFTYVR